MYGSGACVEKRELNHSDTERKEQAYRHSKRRGGAMMLKKINFRLAAASLIGFV
jgi:hypothetical protein